MRTESYLQEMKQLLQQYFLLLNGKRAMKGDLDLAGNLLLTTNLALKEESNDTFSLRNRADTAYVKLRLERLGVQCDPDDTTYGGSLDASPLKINSDWRTPFYAFGQRDPAGSVVAYFGNMSPADTLNQSTFELLLRTSTRIRTAFAFVSKFSNVVDGTRKSYATFWVYDGGGVNALIFDGKEVSIPYAGDISFLDDKFLGLGKDSDAVLPNADAGYRGKMIRIEGGAGVADHVFVCRKLADDSYEWTQLA